MDKPIPVIILDTNIRATEGVIYSFGSRNIPVIALSSEKNPPAFHSRYVKKKYISPKVQDEKALLDFLINLPHKGVLLYSDDASTAFTSKYKEKLLKAGYLINVPDYDKLLQGFDKAQLYLAARQCQVPAIPTVIIEKEEDLEKAWQELDKPVIIKPTRLAGGKFIMVRHKNDLLQAYQQIKRLTENPKFRHLQSGIIAQEFIEYGYDDIYCCESYYTKSHQPVGFLSIHKIRPNINPDGTSGGRLYAGETIRNQDLETYTHTILDHLNWNGFAHLDWFYSKKYQQYQLCEINPRLPGFSNLITKVNFEMAYYYYADLCDLPIPEFHYRDALYFEALRMPGDFTGGLFSIFKGHISVKSFVGSYLKIFQKNKKVYFDVLYKNDLKFNLASWLGFLFHFLKRPFRFLNK
ncbi:MAG: hypothetical protein ACNS62_03220 [Candidatus Cyclobacteriaceae bacterium M3_2C_046]